MKPASWTIAGGAVLLLAAACAQRGPQRLANAAANNAAINDRQVELRILMRYDANHDNVLTRTELEDGLKRDFAAADVNRDGHLDAQETDAENERRWRAEGPAASPIMDWNEDGMVDMMEFGATARSLFDQLDRDHNGTLTADELRVVPVRGQAGPEGRGGRGGRGGGRGGPDGD